MFDVLKVKGDVFIRIGGGGRLGIQASCTMVWYVVGLVRLAKMVELPFSLVEKEAFRKFIWDLQPKFHIVSRFTIARDCRYLFKRQKLKE